MITYAGQPVWVPGEDTLLWIVSGGTDKGTMCMADAAGNDRRALVRAAGGAAMSTVTWARDGSRLEFLTRHSV